MVLYLQLFASIFLAAFLLWFGYTLVFRFGKNGAVPPSPHAGPDETTGSVPAETSPGNTARTSAGMSAGSSDGSYRVCPVCSARLFKGERVHSSVYPPGPDQTRLMHIDGCVYCLEGKRIRQCPVCGAVLGHGDMLIARMFDKPGRSHVHVLGCSRCRGPQAKGGQVELKIPGKPGTLGV
jgi:hypothetical protein